MLVCEQAALLMGDANQRWFALQHKNAIKTRCGNKRPQRRVLATCAVQVNLWMISTTDQSQNGLVFRVSK